MKEPRYNPLQVNPPRSLTNHFYHPRFLFKHWASFFIHHPFLLLMTVLEWLDNWIVVFATSKRFVCPSSWLHLVNVNMNDYLYILNRFKYLNLVNYEREWIMRRWSIVSFYSWVNFKIFFFFFSSFRIVICWLWINWSNQRAASWILYNFINIYKSDLPKSEVQCMDDRIRIVAITAITQ